MAQCGNCKKYEDCHTGSGLTWPCGAYRPVVTTNADRIRAMSDEELADMFMAIPYIPCDNKMGTCDGICRPCQLDWLQQPAEEG